MGAFGQGGWELRLLLMGDQRDHRGAGAAVQFRRAAHPALGAGDLAVYQPHFPVFDRADGVWRAVLDGPAGWFWDDLDGAAGVLVGRNSEAQAAGARPAGGSAGKLTGRPAEAGFEGSGAGGEVAALHHPGGNRLPGWGRRRWKRARRA